MHLRQNIHSRKRLFVASDRERFLKVFCSRTTRSDDDPLFSISSSRRREVSLRFDFTCCVYITQKKNWKSRDHTTEEEFEVGGVLL